MSNINSCNYGTQIIIIIILLLNVDRVSLIEILQELVSK